MANLFYLLTAGSLMLTAFLLFTRPHHGNRQANRWLAIFLWSLNAVFLDECFSILDLSQQIPFSSELLGMFLLAVGPAFYVSVRSFTHPEPIRLRDNLFHFLPFLVFLLLTVSMLFVGGTQLTSLTKQVGAVRGERATLLILTFTISQLLAYYFLSLHLLNRHRQTVTAFASSPDLVDLSWLTYLLVGVCFLWVGLATLGFPALTGYVPISYFAGAFYSAYFSLNQGEIFPFTEAENTAIADILAEATNPPANQEIRKALLLRWPEPR